MLLRQLLPLIIATLITPLAAQDKYDQTWVLGYPPNRPNNNQNGGVLLNFINEDPDTVYIDIILKLIAGNGQICDEKGEPIFYTNNCQVARFPTMPMENGDGLNPDDQLRDFWCGHNYYNMHQGIVTLPWPGHPGQYGIFHLAWKRYQVFPTIDRIDKFYFTHVDMAANNGAGLVREKNQLLLLDTFADNLTAVRHGNGRDWWLIAPSRGTDTLFLFLFQPDGIHGPLIRQTGLRRSNQLHTFGQAVFSPDGTRYVYADTYTGVHILEFDRCRGTFSCPMQLPYPGKDEGPCGAAISAGGQYLYVSTPTQLYQYDLRVKDIESSKTLTGEYDGFQDPFPSGFYQQMLAPNGKIYMTATNGQRFLHVIHQPDSAGATCDFRQHDLALPSYNGSTLPNFPHFRLYDLPYSPCDTAGVDAPKGLEVLWRPDNKIRLLGNPGSERVFVLLPPCARGEIRVYSLAGVLLTKYPVSCEKTVELDCSLLPAAAYIVTYAPSDGSKPLSAKLVVAR
ncbi:MAG: hypothetical protein IT259_08380 [Saprospiraceae bacterium]|nr:hypothetical protein [Saprospiraceae bacterium]